MDSLALVQLNITVDDSSCVYTINDDCVNAIETYGSSATGDNTNASSNATFGGPAIWYSVVGNGGDITVETCLSFMTLDYLYMIHVMQYLLTLQFDFCGLQSSITLHLLLVVHTT